MPQMITRVSESPKNAGIIIQGTQRLIIVLQLAVVHLSNASPTFSTFLCLLFSGITHSPTLRLLPLWAVHFIDT